MVFHIDTFLQELPPVGSHDVDSFIIQSILTCHTGHFDADSTVFKINIH